MGEIDDILTRVETGDASADAKALAAEVRRLRTELQSQREADTDRVLDQMTDLFPTKGAKRMEQRRTARRKDDLESGLPDPQHPRQDDLGQP